jgi:hypothetical protein
MNDIELKKALESIRHTAIRAHLEIDEVSLLTAFFKPSALKKIDSTLTELALDMLELEDAFDENITIPRDINTAIMRSSQLSILFSIRSTTNEAIGSAKSTISQIYNNLNFYRSLLIALVALVISVVGVA